MPFPRFIPLFFFLSIASGCYAQQLKFKNYSSSDGLLSDEVYNLHQDNEGYIWVFTNYGTLKYNGREFKHVLTNLPFNESFIYGIYENKFGRKWVANSNAKIFEVVNDSAFVVHGTEKTSEILRKTISEILQLHVDDSLNIYVVTKRDSYKFIKKAGSYYPVKLYTNKEDSITNRIYELNGKLLRIINFSGKDTLLCGGIDHIKVLFITKNKTFYHRINCWLSGPRVFKRFGDDIYYSDHDRIVKLSNGKFASTSIKPIILNFTKDQNNHLWVACHKNGLFELDEQDSIINHYFDKTTINDVLIDSQNGLWVSSENQGLFYCQNLNDKYYTTESPIGMPVGNLKIFNNELFVVNSIGDVFKIKKGVLSIFLNHDVEDEPLDFIKRDSNYILTYRYRLRHSEAIKGLEPREGRKLSAACKILWLEGDTLIFLSRKHVFFKTRNNFKKYIDFNYRAYSCEMRGGTLLISTERGVWQLVNNKLIQPDYLQKTKDHIIKNISVDSLKNYWFCSEGGGLFKLDPRNSVKQYTNLSKLPGNIVNNISFRGSEALLATNDGLYYNKNADKDEKFWDWKKIYSGSVDGAVFFEGSIYASTKRGLVVLQSMKESGGTKIHFNTSSIKINNIEVNKLKLGNLDHNENNLEFSFDLLTFNNDLYDLRYRLLGANIDSGIVNANTIILKKISPGSYTLVVEPVIDGGELLRSEIPFNIQPAFWQKPVFLILFFLFLALLFTYLIYVLFKVLKKKEFKKAEAERLILEYKLIALKAQINPHFMSNCLSAIQNLLLNNKFIEATDYLAKFGRLVRHILNFSSRSLITLAEELEISALNISLEQLRFENKFHYELIIDRDIDPKTFYIPALIMNPIIENAIWHGLLPLKNRRSAKLLIKITGDEELLFLTIRDNGVGRIGNNSNFGNIHESKGIKLTEQRLNNINYIYGKNISSIVYTDLYDERKARIGTEVVISIPKTLKPIRNE